MNAPASDNIQWDLATGYDFFVSLWSLYSPTSFGLRGRWASGMRARVPSQERRTIERAEALVFDKRPSHWVYTLPPPKDGQTVLSALRAMPPGQRLPTLALRLDRDQRVNQRLHAVAERGAWSPEDLEFLQEHFRWLTGGRPGTSALRDMLDIWADAEAFGERYLQALEIYYEAFFAREEARLAPLLASALERTRALAEDLSLSEMLDHFARNSNWRVAEGPDEWVFAPSVWVSPWVFTTQITSQKSILLFAAQVENETEKPGVLAPPDLVKGLKAIADPTRLAILQLLGVQALTPTMLAAKLGLRPATVAHHLKILRQTGLVNPGIRQGVEQTYTARPESMHKIFRWAGYFIEKEE